MKTHAIVIGFFAAVIALGCEPPGNGPVCQTGTEGCLCIQPDLCVTGLACVSGRCVPPTSRFPTSDVSLGDAPPNGDSSEDMSDSASPPDAADGVDTALKGDTIGEPDGTGNDDVVPPTDTPALPDETGGTPTDASGPGETLPPNDATGPLDASGADAETCATPGGDDGGAPPGAVCQDQEMLACGQSISGETGLEGTWGEMNLYSCTNAYADNADEHVYGFSVDVSTNVTLTLTPTGGDDLNLWLLAGACDPNNCIDYSHLYNPEVVNFVAVPGLDYHIVVDGWSFHTGPYTLQVDCQSEF